MSDTVSTITETIRRVIEERLEAAWVNGAALRTPIQYPGVTRLKNTDGTLIDDPPTDSPWIKLEIQWSATVEATISVNQYLNRNTGVIQISVYAPDGSGTSQLETFKGLARAVFSRFDGDGGLRCRASQPGPNYKDDPWLVGIIKTEFECYEAAA